MLYKTMVLGLLEAQPVIRSENTLMLNLDLYSELLRSSHQAWIATLIQKRPGSNSEVIASEALELALADLQEHFQRESQAAGTGPLWIEAVMNTILSTNPAS